MFIDEKEIDFSSDWQKYLGDSYSMDMNLYFQNEGSRFCQKNLNVNNIVVCKTKINKQKRFSCVGRKRNFS